MMGARCPLYTRGALPAARCRHAGLWGGWARVAAGPARVDCLLLVHAFCLANSPMGWPRPSCQSWMFRKT